MRRVAGLRPCTGHMTCAGDVASADAIAYLDPKAFAIRMVFAHYPAALSDLTASAPTGPHSLPWPQVA